MPLAPEKGVESEFSKAVDRCGHLALKRLPPHLAIGHDLQANCLLERDGLIDRAVFDLFELCVADGLRGELLLSAKQLRRSQQAADDIGVRRDHGRL